MIHKFTFPITLCLVILAVGIWQTQAQLVHAQSATLNPGPFTVENLGSPLQSAIQEKVNMFRLPDGSTHLLMYYLPNLAGQMPTQILDITMETGAAHLTDTAAGRPGVHSTILHPNGKIYAIFGRTFIEYDPKLHTSRSIASISDTAGGQFSVLADNNKILLGQATRPHVDSYDPATNTYERYGIMDDYAPGTSYYRYAYTLGGDNRYIYVSVGQNPWYLVIVDTTNKSQTVYFKNDTDTSGSVYRGVNGGWYYKRGNSAKTVPTWYKLENGQPTEVVASSIPALVPYDIQQNLAQDGPANFPKFYSWEVNLDDAYPDSSNNGVAVFRYRRVGDTTWKETTVTDFRIGPITIKKVYPNPLDNSQLLIMPEAYETTVLYNPVTKGIIKLGRTQRSMYDAVFKGGKWYFSGYPASTMEWDPAQSWTLTKTNTNKITDVNINPHQLTGIAKYHYYNAVASDGTLYVGVHHERDSTGGDLGWYEPGTNKLTHLREPFVYYDVRQIIAAKAGTKIIYSSTSLNGSEAKLFVFDNATKSVEKSFVPVPGVTQLDKIVEVGDGIILGIIPQTQQFYKVDITTGKTVWVKSLGGTAFPTAHAYDRRITLGPDNWVWLNLDNYLTRINPSDGTIQKIVQIPAGLEGVTFHSGNAYFYGTNTLYKISGLFGSVSPQCSGDLNGDKQVNLSDYSLLVQAFLKSPVTNAAADINNDGSVNLVDYSLLVSAFLKPCP